MTPEELRIRLAQYAVDVSLLVRPLFDASASRDAAAQAVRASASAAANYRAACVARSHAEFRAKLGLALEECDEALFWLIYLRDAKLSDAPNLPALISEGGQLTRILGASKRTARIRARREAEQGDIRQRQRQRQRDPQ